jgi:ATP-dependent protease HslVU (ClpYQ) peptidase subunit
MTCIVGLKHKGHVYIGGDSAGVGGYKIESRVDPKVHEVGSFLFGFTTSFRMGQLLGHTFVPPKQKRGQSIHKFMVTDFIDAVRQCLKDGGYARSHNGEESGGTFIVGYKGHLFTVYDDYQIAETSDDYCAVGCGEDIAKGAMFASRDVIPVERIKQALYAASHFSAGVRPPFLIVKQKKVV